MSSFCFATMAVGSEYITLAKKLVGDINLHCPTIKTYVLTDSPDAFSDLNDVQCIKFMRTGFWYIYHEKRQVIEAAILDFDICLFLDSDCRFVNPPPIDSFVTLPPGVYGAYLQSVVYKFQGELSRYDGKERFLKNTPKRRARLLTNIGYEFNLIFWDCNFIQEAAILYVSNQDKKTFFHAWEYIGNYLSVRMFEWGEGFALGIAARYLNINTGEIPRLTDWMFKDILTPKEFSVTEKYRILIEERSQVEKSAKKNKLAKVKKHLSAAIRLISFLPKWCLFLSSQQKMKALNTNNANNR
jgi:hypothetical protein